MAGGAITTYLTVIPFLIYFKCIRPSKPLLDEDADGKISKEDFNVGFDKIALDWPQEAKDETFKELDPDGSGEIELPEWEAAIETALKAKLAQRAADRERRAKEAAAEIAGFTAEFLNAARKVFEMIDKDDSGALAKAEIVEAVKSDEEVKDFLQNCGEENLQFLLKPKRLDHALQQLDTDNSGEVDVEECTVLCLTCIRHVT